MSEWIYVFVMLTAVVGGLLVRSLSASGAIAAFVVGTMIAFGFDWKGILVLGAFFASSSLWSKFQKHRKNKILEKVEKGDQRDFVQVLANGSVPAMISILYSFFPSPIWIELFIVSLAAANADTWASEIGALSKGAPRLITTWQTVEPGTSGAVTLLGTIAALGGACWIGGVSFLLWHDINILLISLFGFLGSLVDTLLGVFCQSGYRCSVCGLHTEKIRHCGRLTIHTKGWKMINNDMVNWLSIVIATTLYFFIIPFRT